MGQIYCAAMFIRITDGTAELVDADDFTAFHVERGTATVAEIVAALGDTALPGDVTPSGDTALLGEVTPPSDTSPPSDSEHLWLSAIGVAKLAGDRGAGEWIAKFDDMCQYAESKGWMNEAGTHIRAHLE